MTLGKTIELEGLIYKLLERLPESGQAEVFKVCRLDNKKIYALKIAQIWNKKKTHLPSSRLTTNQQRIKKEIEFLKALKEAEGHFIVACLASGEVEDGQYKRAAFVMPYYAKTLDFVLLNEKVSIKRRLKWVEQMIIALKYIHDQHKEDGEALIHRDFKLDNLMLTEADDIRLLDFGIAKDIVKSTNGVHTKMMYSNDCVAPEQVFISKPNVNGSKIVDIGTHTDMYALGIMIYRLFANQLPDSHEKFIKGLDDGSLKDKHKKLLNKDGIGLLGKVGGFSNAEKEVLKQKFITLAEASLPIESKGETSGTLLEEDDELIDIDKIARDFADFVQKLMHKRYQSRPVAEAAFYWVKNIILNINALDKIIPSEQNNKEAPIDNKPKESIETKKEEEEKKPQKKPKSPISERPPNIPKDPKDPKDPEDPEKPFFSRFPQLLVAKKMVTKISGSLVLTGILIVAIWKVVPINIDTPDPEIQQLAKDLYAQDIVLQDKAWQQLHKKKSNDAAKQVLKQYEEKVETWISGDNSRHWTDGIIGLKRSAQENDTGALAWLAYVYEIGRGVEIDWGKAWDYYKKAIQLSEDQLFKQKVTARRNALERKAYHVLKKGSSESESEQAYKVMNKVANNNSSSQEAIKNARLWLKNRY